MWGVVQ